MIELDADLDHGVGHPSFLGTRQKHLNPWSEELFEDSDRHAACSKVADAVIEAALSI
jgi:hypothetical protein